MLANWTRFFDFACAQILLTYDDLRNRTRYVNAKNTLRELIKNQVLPIVNENDTVAVNELKVGDNDNLAAYTALVSEADTLIICSDIDGLYTADPRKHNDATLISEVNEINDSIYGLAGGAGTSVGTGGMITKIEAADKCAKSGIQTLIINGKKANSFAQLLQGNVTGTLFHPKHTLDSAKRQWLQHTLKSKGVVIINTGAHKALISGGASLLPIGVVGSHGEFVAGDAVDIVLDGQTVGKGISLYSQTDLHRIMGKSSQQISEILGYCLGEEAIHRDDLVLSED
ncbi:MAG: glutamate 5-kinase, partial [Glaciecola sp.]